MRRFNLSLTPLLALTLVGCTYTRQDVPIPDPIGMELTRTETGQLRYCDQEQNCTDHENPDDCHVLTLSVDFLSGQTCETCTDANDQVIVERCDGSRIVCALLTAPEPDCAVCSEVDGPVLVSTCTPVAPDCAEVDAHTGEAPTASTVAFCDKCFDGAGRVVSSTCTTNCANQACAAVTCEPGQIQMTPPGSCCPVCVQEDQCTDVVCSLDFAPVECPAGSVLTRDPSNCCHYLCEPQSCPTPDPTNGTTTGGSNYCPLGYTWVSEFPTCGQCVDDPVTVTMCTSSADCLSTEFCTTESGACKALPCPEGETCSSPTVCYGECRPANTVCSGTSLDQSAVYCEGELVSEGLDANGCPLPPTCQCPDGTTSFDGTCGDSCANVDCTNPIGGCDPGYYLSFDYPNCCGTCVPDGSCLAGTTTDPNGGSTGTFGCAEVMCGPGFHPEIGPDCCEVCVRDTTSCLDNNECLTGEMCKLDQNRNGTCEPMATCRDTDAGVDLEVKGAVSGTLADGVAYQHVDICEGSYLNEFYCYSPFAGSTQTAPTISYVLCPNGCVDGACVPDSNTTPGSP